MLELLPEMNRFGRFDKSQGSNLGRGLDPWMAAHSEVCSHSAGYSYVGSGKGSDVELHSKKRVLKERQSMPEAR